jgi:hypothetical protein
MNNPVSIENEFAFGAIPSLGDAAKNLVSIFFTVAGILIAFYFLIAVYHLIISSGDKNDIAQARGMITHAIIGFVLLVIMFLVVEYLPRALLLPNFSIITR